MPGDLFSAFDGRVKTLSHPVGRQAAGTVAATACHAGLATAMLLPHGSCGKPHLHFLQTLKKYAD
jgi:hypothetical protein